MKSAGFHMKTTKFHLKSARFHERPLARNGNPMLTTSDQSVFSNRICNLSNNNIFRSINPDRIQSSYYNCSLLFVTYYIIFCGLPTTSIHPVTNSSLVVTNLLGKLQVLYTPWHMWTHNDSFVDQTQWENTPKFSCQA